MSEKGFDHREDAVKLGIRVKSLYKNVIHTYIYFAGITANIYPRNSFDFSYYLQITNPMRLLPHQ